MRKVYVLCLLAFVAVGNAFGQRTIDWSVEEIVEPTQLNSDASTGTAIAMKVVLKNNGTDDVKSGDTLLYQLAALAGQQLVFAYPSAQQFAFRVMNRGINSGDTMHLNINLSTTSYVRSSVNITLAFVSYIRNNGSDAITAEVSPGTANNIAQKNVVWYNPQGWGVSVSDVTEASDITISPNPATDQVKVAVNLSDASANTIVRVYDLNGRLVAEETLEAGSFTTTMDVSSLETGLYVVEVTAGEVKSTKKLQVAQ